MEKLKGAMVTLLPLCPRHAPAFFKILCKGYNARAQNLNNFILSSKTTFLLCANQSLTTKIKLGDIILLTAQRLSEFYTQLYYCYQS